MNEFLLEARRNLGRIDEFDTVQVVMGNESCDLDSAVSALVFGLYLSRASGGDGGPSKRVGNPSTAQHTPVGTTFEDRSYVLLQRK